MVTQRHVSKYLGQHVHCHTHYGTFQGVIIHLSKHHVILGRVPSNREWTYDPTMASDRQMPGTGSPVGPSGPGGPGMGPGGGGGWHMAIPIAAILGITAVGMHWW